MACCRDCALGDLDDLLPADKGRPVMVLALAVLGLGALVYLFPEKQRAKRRYHEPELRRTRELPAETMEEVVYGRRR